MFSPDPPRSRRFLMGAARRLLVDAPGDPSSPAGGDAALPGPRPDDDPPRLTLNALRKIHMSRSRDRILSNLDDMYREAFERAKTAGDDQQMATLDFAYRREQLYFEILLDIRDAMERR